MKTVKITFGQKTYTVEELPTKRNAAWRGRLEEELKPVSQVLEGGRELATSDMNAQNLGVVSGLAQQIMAVALKSMDTIVELVFAYSPALAQDRQAIEETAFDSEFTEAFLKILEVAYPFGGVVKAIGNLSSGPA